MLRRHRLNLILPSTVTVRAIDGYSLCCLSIRLTFKRDIGVIDCRYGSKGPLNFSN